MQDRLAKGFPDRDNGDISPSGKRATFSSALMILKIEMCKTKKPRKRAKIKTGRLWFLRLSNEVRWNFD